VQGKNRTFVLVLPRAYDPSRLHPIVLGYHGDGGSGAQIRGALGLEAAAKEPTIFLYPDAAGDGFDLESAPGKNADVAFFDAALAHVMETYCVARARVMVTGYSRGGYMANQLACWRGAVIRGVAPQAAGGPFDATGKAYDDQGHLLCPGMGPVSALLVHGQADTNVKFSETNDTLAFYRAQGRCGAAERATPDPCVSHACAEGRQLRFCAIPGMGHGVWPKAAATVMEFFASLR
jgi:polyhydroxybutyrate depolymerase